MPRYRRLKKLAKTKLAKERRRARRLRHEPLEKRDLLAVITVDTDLDVVDLDDGVTSLREAIFAANTVPGHQEIVFDFGFDGPATIVLTEGELQITDSLTITGDGPDLLTIDASGSDPTPDENNADGSRVFSVRDFDSGNTLEVTIQGVTLTGGDAAGEGGAIVSSEALTIVDSVITENHSGSSGGGVFSSDLLIRGSVISGNSSGLNGGGLFAFRLVVEDSQVANNVADSSGGGIAFAGGQSTIRNSHIIGNETNRGAGGGISLTSTRAGSPTLLLTGSVVSDNRAAAEGGGIRSNSGGRLTIHESHIARNYAVDVGGGLAAFGSVVEITSSSFDSNIAERQGGGIASFTFGSRDRSFEVINSTIARNRSEINGGGIYVESLGLVDFAVRHSTIVDNEVDLDLGELSALLGGGIVAAGTEVVLDHTIVFGNSVFGGASDLTAFEGSFTAESSAIGVIAPGTPAFLNNTQLGIDPLLSGPQGGVGPTLVYALQPGSPAIDAGDPTLIAGMDGVPAFDQRGAFFFRQQGVIDIGAFEVQPEGLGEVDADFDRDGDVDGSDFLILQRNLGATGLGEDSRSFGDADGDRDVDHNDRLAWEYLFGMGEVKDGAFLSALAVEAEQPPPVVTVDTESDATDLADGDLTLREAIFATNSVPGLEEIVFDFGFDGPVSILLTEGELQIADSLIITGDSADLLTIDASGNDPTPDSTLSDGDSTNDGDGSRVFFVSDGDYTSNFDVELNGMTITGGDTRGSGGGVRSAENLWLVESRVIGNQVGPAGRGQSSGGGVSSFGSLSVVSSLILDNEAISFGGGVSVGAGDLEMVDSTISGNTANFGGGVDARARGYAVEITGSTFSNNTATGRGGGLLVYARDVELGVDEVREARVLIAESNFNQNSADSHGGGIAFDVRFAQGGVTLRDVNAFANSAGTFGGAVSVQGLDSSLAIEGGQFGGNSGVLGGGGLSFLETSSPRDLGLQVSVTGASLRTNETQGDGGGIYANFDVGTLTVDGGQIFNNQANTGGGIFTLRRDSEDAVFLEGATVSNNTADSWGGGVWVGEGGLVVNRSEVRQNTAGNGGGGLFVENLTMTDSSVENNQTLEGYGGGASVSGDAVIVGSTIERNDAVAGGGGLQLGGGGSEISRSTIIHNEAVDGRGGGVYVRSGQTVLIEDSLVAENAAGGDGGGLYSFFTDLQISGSTFAENRATSRGGGVYALAAGGASDEFVNSTFSENHADVFGGGVHYVGRGFAELGIRHSTIYLNTAGNANSGEPGEGAGVFTPNARLELDHSIVFWNSLRDGSQEDIAEQLGRFLVESSLIGTIRPGTEAILNNTLLGINPHLDSLQDNGGPTPTHAPRFESPVIDAGDPTLVAGVDGVPEFDQRGEPFDRVSGPAIDIGAVELQQFTLFEAQAVQTQSVQQQQRDDEREPDDESLPAPLAAAAAAALVTPSIEDDVPTVVVTTTADVVDFNDGVTSLREAVFAANTVPWLQKIEFDFPFDGPAKLVLTEGELVVTDSLIIVGDSADLLTIDASGNDPTPDEDNGDGSRVFDIRDFDFESALDVTIRGVTLTGGDPGSLGGGAVLTSENLTLVEAVITGNHADSGGGVYSYGYGSAASLTILDSIVSQNSTSRGPGGGIFATSLFMESSEVRENSAASSGGGIAIRGGDSTIVDSQITGNHSDSDGGGIGVSGRRRGIPSLVLTGSEVADNTSVREGGGIRFSSGTLTIEDSLIARNRTDDFGGGLFSTTAAVAISGSTFDSNHAQRVGGAIAMFSSPRALGPFDIVNSTLSQNTAEELAGGIYADTRSPSPLLVRHSTVAENAVIGDRSPLGGGGIYANAGEVIVDHTIVWGNLLNGVDNDLASRLDQGSFAVESSLVGVIAPGTPAFVNNTLLGFDPLLGALQDNGGPTPTYELLPGSPAIDAGDPALMAGMDGVPAFDQRGAFFFRQQGVIDIGAFEVQPEGLGEVVADFDGDGDVDGTDFLIQQRNFGATGLGEDSRSFGDADGDRDVDHNDRLAWEYLFGMGEVKDGEFLAALAVEAEQPPPVVIVDTESDATDLADGDLTLREAIFATNTVPGLEEIVFDFGFDGPVSILLTEGELPIADSLIITGDSADLLTIDASGNDPTPLVNNSDGSRVLNIDDGNFLEAFRVAITGVTIRGGDSGSGAGILSNEELYLERVVVTDNHGGSGGRSQGGGINSSVSLTVVDSVVSDNSVGGRGGGIFSSGDWLSISETSISGNLAASGGGVGAVVLGGFVEILGGSISGNTATGDGGGVSIFGRSSSNIEIDQVLVIDGTSLEGNTAAGNGGAILLEPSRFGANYTLREIDVAGNAAEGLGGGVAIIGEEGEVLVQQSSFTLNTSGGGGGGVAIVGPAELVVNVEGSAFEGNAAGLTTESFGGGLLVQSEGGTIGIDGSDFLGNTTNGRDGGGIAVLGGNATIADSLVSGNRAVGSIADGGGVYGGPIGGTPPGNLELTRTTIVGNSADRDGGGLEWYGGSVRIESSSLSQNNAGNRGGGIWAGSTESFEIIDSELSENTANSDGGAAFFESISVGVVGSDIRGNVSGAEGGGFALTQANPETSLRIEGSQVRENESASSGGGISIRGVRRAPTGNLEIIDSVLSGNQADSDGGGLFAFLTRGFLISGSTLSSNDAGANGGGAFLRGAGTDDLPGEITGSTVSGNTARGSGGGLSIEDGSREPLSISYTTIAENTADSDGDSNGTGGGVFSGAPVGLSHTIVFSNRRFEEFRPEDLAGPEFTGVTTFSVSDSLVGVIRPGTTASLNNTLLGIDPLLDSLADNGGPTPTHSLLPGSPAIDAGDPALMAGVDGVPEFDQRGPGFARVSGSSIDIGAFEVQNPPPRRLSGEVGDVDGDGDFDLADLLAAQRGVAAAAEAPPVDFDLPVDAAEEPERDAVFASAFMGPALAEPEEGGPPAAIDEALAAAAYEPSDWGPQRPADDDAAENDLAFAQWGF